MRLIVGKSFIFIPRIVCLKDFGFKFKKFNIKFKQLKELTAGIFAKDNNNIKVLKGPITLFKDNYTKKIINIVKDGKVY